jgi:hypothetical protein
MPKTKARQEHARRMGRVRRALSHYDEPTFDSAVVDVLADLRHYCDALGADFADLDRVAHDHYKAKLWEGKR